MSKKNIKQLLYRFFYWIGYLPVNIKDLPQGKRAKIIESLGIDRVLDVGANAGQFAQEIRAFGYRDEIVSFEPLSDAFTKLSRHANRDNKWRVENIALGDQDGMAEINIAANSYSSSLLDIKERHIEAAPDSAYVGKEKISIKKLDTVYSDYCDSADRVMLKIDAQGYESKVIEGSKESLEKIVLVQMELSLVPLYEEEVLFLPMAKIMEDLGFQIVSLAPAFSNTKTGQLYQVDCLFIRQDNELQLPKI